MALDLAQMVLVNQKNLRPTHFYMLNIFGFNNFPQKSSNGVVLALSLLQAVYGPGLGLDGPGDLEKPLTNPVIHAKHLWILQISQKNQALGSSLPSANSWLSMALDLAQMVLEIRKNLRPTQFYMLNMFDF